MRRPLAKVLLTAVTLIGLVGVLVATVGDDSDRSSGPNLIAAAADLADAQGTARVLFTMSFEGAPGAPTMGGDGVLDLRSGESQLNFTMDGLPLPDGSDSFSMEMRVVGTSIYVHLPFLTEEMGLAKPWLSVNLEDAGMLEEFGLGDLGSNDPSQTLEYLRGAADDITEIGTELVRDVATTHYRAELDLATVLDEVPKSQRDLVARSIEEFRAQFGTTIFPMDVWIDDDGLPRRMRYELDLGGMEGAPPAAGMTLTMELYDYGVPVEVSAPPDDQVADLTSLLGALGTS